ncbi:MAG: hypothetical protein WAV86_15705 [Lutibacter sp.]
MNTKKIMMSSAIFLGVFGITLTFIPDLMLNYLDIIPNKFSILFTQTLGALYFAFGLLNWMSKGSIIGGIYNRPIAISNFSHFFIVGIAFLKELLFNFNSLVVVWIFGIFYAVYGLLFGLILFYNPVNSAKK